MSDSGSGVVVVGVDGSEHALTALRHAVDEARMRGWDLHVVFVSDLKVELFYIPESIPVDAAELIRAQREGVWEVVDPVLDELDIPVTKVSLEGYAADQLVEYCDAVNAGLLVVGTRGRGRLVSTLLGSTSLRSVQNAKCDVFVAKPR
jgi:nucleotide-binding universal stress UspA family protein